MSAKWAKEHPEKMREHRRKWELKGQNLDKLHNQPLWAVDNLRKGDVSE